MPTYRHQYKFSLTIKHKFTTLAFVKWQLLTKKTKNFEFYPLYLKHQAHKVRISSCVCFCIKFCFYLCKFAKTTSKINAIANLAHSPISNLMSHFLQRSIFNKKAKNYKFICHLKRQRDYFFFKTLYHFLPNTKSRPLHEI